MRLRVKLHAPFQHGGMVYWITVSEPSRGPLEVARRITLAHEERIRRMVLQELGDDFVSLTHSGARSPEMLELKVRQGAAKRNPLVLQKLFGWIALCFTEPSVL